MAKIVKESTKKHSSEASAKQLKSKLPIAPEKKGLKTKKSKEVMVDPPVVKETNITEVVEESKPGRKGKKQISEVVSETVAVKPGLPSKKKKSVEKQKDLIQVMNDDVGDEGWMGFGGVEKAEEVAQKPQKKDTTLSIRKKNGISQNTKGSMKKFSEPESQSEKDEESGADEEVYLHGFSSDDQNSSDEEDLSDEAPPIDVQKLPTIAKDDRSVKQKLDKAKRQPTQDRGVISLGRIPHGFYEEQMKAYFTQFGEVTRLRLSRNKKTGHSKHYAFIEFESSRVAEIVAETMDNYLLMGHIMKCRVIPKAEVHPELWIGANKKFKVLPRARLERDSHNKLRTEQEQVRAANRLVRRQSLKKRKLEELGIDYNFDSVTYKKKSRTVDA